MYYLLKNNKLKEVIEQAIKKARTYRKLSKEIKIPVSTICDYRHKNHTIKKESLDKLLKYLGIKITEEDIIKTLPDNWKQIIGGQNCVKKKIKEGTLNQQLTQSRKNIKKTIGDWHKKMKNENPEAYHLIQYEHFKKIGNYKLETINKEKVRNSLEKKVANILKKLNISYQYEPLVKVGNRYFFPDFLIDNKIILECTMWRGYDKAIKLKEKIAILSKKYKIYVIIPKKLEKYYQSIKPYLITDTRDLELF